MSLIYYYIGTEKKLAVKSTKHLQIRRSIEAHRKSVVVAGVIVVVDVDVVVSSTDFSVVVASTDFSVVVVIIVVVVVIVAVDVAIVVGDVDVVTAPLSDLFRPQ